MFEVLDGVLINRVDRGPAVAGRPSGSLNSWGYVQFHFQGSYYKAHRVVWLICKGYWPEELDHINGNRTDNRIENLREVTRQENLRNQKIRSNNTSGVMGVGWDKCNRRWTARIRYEGKNKCIGYFKTFDEAAAARKAAEIAFGYHPNHGRAA
ncbi:HNH endonuclease [Pseudomonas syringae pv. tomato]|nr:HNH endonuclease [Pseudomonas syringae pv. tomato]